MCQQIHYNLWQLQSQELKCICITHPDNIQLEQALFDLFWMNDSDNADRIGITETVSRCLWCCRLFHSVEIPFRAALSHSGAVDHKQSPCRTFPGSLASTLDLCWIPGLHFWEFSNFRSFPREVQAHHACLAGSAGTSPEGALTWIIQQLVWKMIVFGSVIDLPPEERQIYSLGAATAEKEQFEACLFHLKMYNRTEIIRRSKVIYF